MSSYSVCYDNFVNGDTEHIGNYYHIVDSRDGISSHPLKDSLRSIKSAFVLNVSYFKAFFLHYGFYLCSCCLCVDYGHDRHSFLHFDVWCFPWDSNPYSPAFETVASACLGYGSVGIREGIRTLIVTGLSRLRLPIPPHGHKIAACCMQTANAISKSSGMTGYNYALLSVYSTLRALADKLRLESELYRYDIAILTVIRDTSFLLIWFQYTTFFYVCQYTASIFFWVICCYNMFCFFV